MTKSVVVNLAHAVLVTDRAGRSRACRGGENDGGCVLHLSFLFLLCLLLDVELRSELDDHRSEYSCVVGNVGAKGLVKERAQGERSVGVKEWTRTESVSLSKWK